MSVHQRAFVSTRSTPNKKITDRRLAKMSMIHFESFLRRTSKTDSPEANGGLQECTNSTQKQGC